MIIIEIAGRLGRDPETRFTPNGQKVTSFSVASTLKKGGKEETMWVRVTVWGDRFDKMMPYLKKGSAVIVIGELSQAPQIYTDKNGQQQVSIDVTAEMIRFSPFGSGERSDAGQAGGQQAAGQQYGGGFGTPSAAQPASQSPSQGYQDAPYGGTPSSNPYTSQQQSSYASYGNHNPNQEDDPLPF